MPQDPANTSLKAARRGWLALLPIALLGVLGAFLAFGLGREPGVLRSELIDRPVPDFSLQTLDGAPVTQDALAGEVVVLNVFGSWCVACLVEHPLLMELRDDDRFLLAGVNWRDRPENARRWLARHGDPYGLIVADPVSRLAIDLGVAGAPETYIVDREGRIRFKHVGPISEDDWTDTLEPIVSQLASTP